jgi:P27 family predicted phage terminase small subunit
MPRPALSIEEHKLKGTRPTRAVEKKTVAEAGRPRMPKHLSAEAQVAWRDAVRLLKKRGTLSAGDAPTIAAYSECVARWIAAKKNVEDNGIVVVVTMVDKNGVTYEREKLNICLKVVEVAEKQMLALAKSLGLSPDSREKVKPTKADPKTVLAPGSAALLYPELVNKKGKK